MSSHSVTTKNGVTSCSCGYGGGSPSDVEYHAFTQNQTGPLDDNPHLLCEFAFDGCEQNHILRDWVIRFTIPGERDALGYPVERTIKVEAGCGYAAEEALFDYAEDKYGFREARMLDLRGV